MSKREINEFNQQYGKRLRNDEFSLDDFLEELFERECADFDREIQNRNLSPKSSPKSDVTEITTIQIVCLLTI